VVGGTAANLESGPDDYCPAVVGNQRVCYLVARINAADESAVVDFEEF
jgi:hypothetical protein